MDIMDIRVGVGEGVPSRSRKHRLCASTEEMLGTVTCARGRVTIRFPLVSSSLRPPLQFTLITASTPTGGLLRAVACYKRGSGAMGEGYHPFHLHHGPLPPRPPPRLRRPCQPPAQHIPFKIHIFLGADFIPK